MLSFCQYVHKKHAEPFFSAKLSYQSSSKHQKKTMKNLVVRKNIVTFAAANSKRWLGIVETPMLKRADASIALYSLKRCLG